MRWKSRVLASPVEILCAPKSSGNPVCSQQAARATPIPTVPASRASLVMLTAMRRASSLVKLTDDRLQALGIELLSRGLRLEEQVRQLGEFRSRV
jgi:hypothetical protein